MASLWKHPNSTYYTACYTNKDGKQVKRSTKSTDRSAALTIALEWERAEKQARAGTITTAQIQKVLNETVAKATGDTIVSPSVKKGLEDWLESKRMNNAAGTVERYTNTVNMFLKSLGEKCNGPITAIEPLHIERFLNERLKSGVAPKTAIVDIKTLRTAFNRAERYGVILKNPVLAVELPKNDSSAREVFTHKQVGQLLDAAGWQSEWFTVILLGYYTGARLSDCVRMKWDNINTGRGVITYQQQKTAKPVVIPMHPELYERFTFLDEFADFKGFVCPDLATRASGGKHGLSESFKRIVKRAGIDTKQVQGKGKRQFNRLTFHSLRHSFNSSLANAGVAQEIRMKFTGHSSVAMNSLYTHHDISNLQTAINTLPSFTAEAAA